MSFTLGFDPIWSNFDLYGVSAGGAKLSSFDSLNPSVEKFIFRDPAGQFPYENPILFDENGNAPGPFYFFFDELNPTSLYNLRLVDADGNTIWQMNSYFPSGGSGGSVVTTAVDLNNLVTNGILWRNLGGDEYSFAPTPIKITAIVTEIAPGAHDGLSANVNPTASITGGVTSNSFGPDITFQVPNNLADEQVSFPAFPLGSTEFSSANDVTPVQYLKHRVVTFGAPVAYRYYQFPITSKVQNLSNQTVTITLWAQSVGTLVPINLYFAQFYGDGTAATGTIKTLITTFTPGFTWEKLVISPTVPNVAGNIPGKCGNDGLFILVELPLSSNFEVNFTKLSMYMGTIEPEQDFILYDNIDSVVNSPRTGDVRIALNNFGKQAASMGWVPMNDGTIGSPASGASTRAKTDTFPLYNLIWNNVTNTYAPVTGGRTTAIGDFDADKPIQLTKALGRVLAGTSNPALTAAVVSASGTVLNITSNVGFNVGDPIVFSTLATLPSPLIVGQIYYVLSLVLTTSITISTTIGGTAVTFLTTGTGTVTMPPYTLGETRGEESHILSIAEMPSHNHPGSFVPSRQSLAFGGTGQSVDDPSPTANIPLTIAAQGGGVAHNIIQPTTYMNMFIKL